MATSQLDHDSIMETLAHEMVYEDRLSERQTARLRTLGYRATPLRHGRYDLQFRGFVDNGTGRDRFPVLAFRGTEGLQDLLTDLETEGVGFRQLLSGLALVRRDIARMGGEVDVTGHSLGGAIAQMVASGFPSQVRRVITFQAPGIPASMVRALERYNRGDRAVSSTHYRAEGDVVSEAGQTFTPGEAVEVGADSSEGSGPLDAHQRFILADLQRLRRTDPQRFASARIEVSGTDREARPVEHARRAVAQTRSATRTGAAELLAWLTSDDAIRASLANDPTFCDDLTFATRLRMIGTLAGSTPAPGNVAAMATIWRTLSRSEQLRAMAVVAAHGRAWTAIVATFSARQLVAG